MTNPTTLIIIIFIIGLFSTGMIIFSGDLAANPNNKLSDESKAFVYEQYGFNVENITINDTENLFYIIENNETAASTKDYTLEFQFFRESSGDFRTTAQQIYNIPQFLLTSFDLPRDDWKFVLNSFNMLIWWIIFFAIYKLLRGLIK
jgi:hypothetical protein